MPPCNPLLPAGANSPCASCHSLPQYYTWMNNGYNYKFFLVRFCAALVFLLLGFISCL